MSEVTNPWVVQEIKQSEQVPIGSYLGVFKGVQEVKFKDPKSQADSLKWRWEWEVVSNAQKGKIASALTDQDINPNTLPGRLISGLLRRPIVVGEDVKAAVASCVGQTDLVIVQVGPKGGKHGVKSANKPPEM